MKNDGTPCNFAASYRTLDIGQTRQDRKTLFSYIVFKKGSRDDDKTINWPRMVRPTQVRTRHTRCKFCTHRGKLEEVVVTKGKHSKYVQYSKVIYSFSNSIALIRVLFFINRYTYRCARKSDWGDRMPIEFEENECDSNETSDISDDEKL